MGLIKKITVGSDSIETDVSFMEIERIYDVKGITDITSNFTIIDYKPGIKQIFQNNSKIVNFSNIIVKFTNGLYKSYKLSAQDREFWNTLDKTYMNFGFETDEFFYEDLSLNSSFYRYYCWNKDRFVENANYENMDDSWQYTGKLYDNKRYGGFIS